MTRPSLRSGLRRLYRSIRPVKPVRSAYLTDAFPAAVPHVLLEGESVPTPETATMNLGPFASYVKAPAYWAPEVMTAPLHRALYCPVNDCLLNADRVVVNESTGPGARAAGLDASALHRSAVEHVDGVWTALRCPFNDFYHFLIDNLSRLDLLHDPYFRQFDVINVFCPGGPTALESYFFDKLSLPNVRLVTVAPDRLYQPETYLFTSFVTKRASGYLRGPFANRIRAAVCSSKPAEEKPTERIYISRSRAASRRVQNEGELMAALRSLGFNAYQLENLSIEKQIDLFSRAECVVSPHGAGLANLLFSPSASVVELFGSHFVVPHYYLLAKSLGLSYTYVCGHSSNRNADMHVEVDHICHLAEQQLMRSTGRNSKKVHEARKTSIPLAPTVHQG